MSVGRGWEKHEYLGKENACQNLVSGAPQLPSAFAAERLLADSWGGFFLDGHRLSSLYRATEAGVNQLTNRYFSAFSLNKYSLGAATWSPLVQEQMAAGWKTPVIPHHTRAHHA
jgi:hypothetical protein